MTQPQRSRFLPAILLSLVCLSATPAWAMPAAPFFSAPVPNGSDGPAISSDFALLSNLLPKVSEQLAQAKAARRDAPLGHATTDFVIATMALTTAGLQIDMGALGRASETLKLAHERLKRSQLLMMPARFSEARGIYLDGSSIPKTRAGIVALLDQLHAARFNLLVPEVFRRGYTAWPSPLSPQDPEFAAAGFDVLDVLMSEAHRRGMEVHPWFWVFRVRSPGYGNPVLDKLPALAALKAGMAEPPRFISPASAEGRAFAAAIIRDLRKRYPADGVLLDYLRYDETLGDDTISVTNFRLDYFKRHGAYPPDEMVAGTPEWKEWQLWREERIHLFVDQLRRDLDVPIGAAVFRGIVGTRLQKMQNWHHWADNGWTRYLSHMLYTADPRDLDLWLDWETDHDKRRDLLYPILGPIRFQRPEDLFPQLDLLRRRQVPGYTLFALLHFNRATLPDLVLGPHRVPAYLPHRDLALAAKREIDGISDWLERLQGDPLLPSKQLSGWTARLRVLWKGIPSDRSAFRPKRALAVLGEIHDSVDEARRAGLIDTAFADELHLRLGYPQQLLEILQQDLAARQRITPPSPPPYVPAKAPKAPGMDVAP